MERVVTIGFDIAKSVFQVHGIDATGAVVVRRKLARGRVLTFFEALPRCQIGMEACNTSHYWARELIAPVRVAHLEGSPCAGVSQTRRGLSSSRAIPEAPHQPARAQARSACDPRAWLRRP